MIAPRLRSIAVFGDGLVGLSAALAFLRALPSVKVTIVAMPISPAALADRLPGGLPDIRHFHRLVSITEQELVRVGAASHRVGTRFEGWREDGTAWHHCFETPRPQISSSPFHHQWLRLRGKDATQPYDDLSPAVGLARAEKFAHARDQQQSLLQSVDYALRLDPEVYRKHLLQLVQGTNTALLSGQIADISRAADGGLAQVLLQDGTRIAADLFVDCGGPEAPLLSRIDASFEDWADFLPCDQIAVAEEAPTASPVDAVTATDAGYVTSLPLPGRSRRVNVRSSACGREAHEPSTDFVTIRPGMRRTSWIGNVVAFGDSAVALEPLESTNLFLAQSAIRRAVTLLPDADFQPLVLQEFNRRTIAECERIRDFVAAHYIASSRRSGAFWKTIDDWKVSDSLAHTLEQFRARGRLPKYEEETFQDESWLSVLFGLGFYPERPDPACYRVDESASLEMFKRVAEASASLPSQLPSYPDYLRYLQRS